jgi:oligoendopeptidase F
MSNELKNTSWDNSHIYESPTDPKLKKDFENTEAICDELTVKSEAFNAWIVKLENNQNITEEVMSLAVELKAKKIELMISYATLSIYAGSCLSVNTQDEKAKELQGLLDPLGAKFNKCTKPLDIFLQKAPENFIEKFLQHPTVLEASFEIRHQRKMAPFLLSSREEILESGLAQNGLYAWGKLYSSLAGSLQVHVGDETLGLAQAAGLLRQGDRDLREKAWRGINRAWEQHEESVAAIINSINGWRLEDQRQRSHEKELHYLDVSCHQNRISRETLNALMKTTYKRRDIGQKALRLMAKTMGLKKLAPFDILAPAPLGEQSEVIPFDKAIDMIAEAFSDFHPKMGEFARMMARNNWIDSAPSNNRAPGAYCTKFYNVREPRVFMTYTGSMGNVVTLAHELGHAYHNWVMRDLPHTESSYPMTLAETASIFAETTVKKALLNKSEDSQAKLKVLWQDVVSASALLINIPTRFEFEKSLIETRKTRAQSPKEMKGLMTQAWNTWYEDTMEESDPMFWASKLHFSIAGLGFYNYPYLFGYLFALGIYAQKDQKGDQFYELYTQILKDTGKMSADDLIKKYLNQDIASPDFWHASLDIVDQTLNDYEQLLKEAL